jgi:preprotein translocase subunit YajC
LLVFNDYTMWSYAEMQPYGVVAAVNESGGILGRVTEVGENFITLEVAEGVRLKVQKPQIAALMPKGTLKGA